jgi:hypothetical protein
MSGAEHRPVTCALSGVDLRCSLEARTSSQEPAQWFTNPLGAQAPGLCSPARRLSMDGVQIHSTAIVDPNAAPNPLPHPHLALTRPPLLKGED